MIVNPEILCWAILWAVLVVVFYAYYVLANPRPPVKPQEPRESEVPSPYTYDRS